MFVVGVYVDNVLLGEGRGKSKKVAEQKAAREALKLINQSR
jgi:dsRNA-specific ribonuclease